MAQAPGLGWEPMLYYLCFPVQLASVGAQRQSTRPSPQEKGPPFVPTRGPLACHMQWESLGSVGEQEVRRSRPLRVLPPGYGVPAVFFVAALTCCWRRPRQEHPMTLGQGPKQICHVQMVTAVAPELNRW
ncbi:hypothetical protein NDU88_007898 [Pleurodeles waltl]|uniref:Uncharacterized protein n=1 Tax=Pleurodeles waltl TaxID=8319 RepID=A0AAV7VTY5_PLEWA|nr:hypothetical protein NDU88_007898 [Pleurodeles waltl]